MTNPLGDLISRGEGGYNSYNRGTQHGHIVSASQQHDFSQMTLEELTRRQRLPISDVDKIFAVGKYQVIPPTMDGAILQLNLDAKAKYGPDVQERIFSDYLIRIKRPAIYDYIVGAPGASLHHAQKAASQEWASIDDPDTPGQPYGEYAKHGNRSSIRAGQVASALNSMHAAYKFKVDHGVSADDAWRGVTGQVHLTEKAPVRLDAIVAHLDSRVGEAPSDDRNASIRHLQVQLNQLGYRDSKDHSLVTDGTCGPKTTHAIKSFQHAHHLNVDGIVGKDTRAALTDAQHSPLLSEATHPRHHLYAQILHGIHQLPTGTYRNERERTSAAVALTISADVGGLRKIDHVVLGRNGTNLFAVQGRMDDPAHRRVYIDHEQAMSRSVDHATTALHAGQMRMHPVQAQIGQRTAVQDMDR